MIVYTFVSGTVYQNQLLYQTCIYIKHFNESVCKPLLGIQSESEEVQVSKPIIIILIFFNGHCAQNTEIFVFRKNLQLCFQKCESK